MRELAVPPEWRDFVCVMTDVTPEDIARSLSVEEQMTAAGFRFQKRREEWASSRIAAKVLAVRRGLCGEEHACRIDAAGGAPILHIGGSVTENLSISHSSHAGAAAIDSRLIGLDIERIREIQRSLTRFFLHTDEIQALAELDDPHALIHFWGAKEAAWKIRGNTLGEGIKPIVLRLVSAESGQLRFEFSRVDTRGDVETRTLEGFVAALAREMG